MGNDKAMQAVKDHLRQVASDNGLYLGDLEPVIEVIVKALRDSGLSEAEIVETFGDPIEGA